MIFNDNEFIYFNQQISNCTGDYEEISLKAKIKSKKMKIYLYDCINDDVKISIKKILYPESKEAKFILFHLGFTNIEHKIIVKCKYLSKSSNCYNINNNKINIIFIITSTSIKGPKIMYKYKLYNGKIIYNNTLLQNIN